VFRFGNTLFEPVWNRNYIDYVEITAAEALGLILGWLLRRDRRLCAIWWPTIYCNSDAHGMEPPVAFDADAVREAKVQVLRAMQPMTPAQVAMYTVRGQYGAGMVEGESMPAIVLPLAWRRTRSPKRSQPSSSYRQLALGRGAILCTHRQAPGTSGHEIAVHFKRTPQALFAHTAAPNRMLSVLRLQPRRITFMWCCGCVRTGLAVCV